jgi:hypothetical protein
MRVASDVGLHFNGFPQSDGMLTTWAIVFRSFDFHFRLHWMALLGFVAGLVKSAWSDRNN